MRGAGGQRTSGVLLPGHLRSPSGYAGRGVAYGGARQQGYGRVTVGRGTVEEAMVAHLADQTV